MTDTCETCRFWAKDSETVWGVLLRGFCRRNAPKLKLIDDGAVISIIKFPPSEKDDWCGEHQPKEPGS